MIGKELRKKKTRMTEEKQRQRASQLQTHKAGSVLDMDSDENFP